MNWTILISFSNFSTENRFDYFRAGNGADYTENMFFEWSGNSLPNDQLSTGNIMWLRFTSDISVTARGFSLTAISFAPPVPQFIFISANETREVSSLSPSGNTTWIVSTTEDRKLLMTFSMYNTVKHASSVHVGDGADFENLSSLFFTWIGPSSSSPPHLISDGNTVWITFQSFTYIPWSRNVLLINSVPFTDSITCSADEFDCGHSVCIDTQHECNGINECINGLDEVECDACNTSSIIAADFNSSISIFSTLPGNGNYIVGNCHWLITSPPSSHIMVHIYSLDVPMNARLFILRGNTSDIYNEEGTIRMLDGGHHNPGHLVFTLQTISIYYPYVPIESAFHLGLQAVHSKDYIDCEAFPYAYLSEDRCDGILQCPNGADEIGCDCEVDEHVCANRICTGRSEAECDGNVDCMDYSDEGIQCNTSYCVDIKNDMCKDVLRYNQTYFSNDLGLSQQQANDMLVEHLHQIISNCSDAQQVALCRSIYPACPRFSSDRVCSSACKDAMECAGLTGNSSLQCDVYPDQILTSGEDNSCGFSEDDIFTTGDCGTQSVPSTDPDPFSRIVGGGESDITKWPWMASYRFNGLHGCGATLISPHWVVTAAHCSGGDNLVFGSSTLDVPFSYQHIYPVAKEFPHPEYTSTNYNNDIMLVKLASPVELSDTIRPACLATEDNEAEIYHTCHAVGWGDTAFQGSLAQVIKEAVLPIQPLEMCLNNAAVKHHLFVSNKQICAGNNEPGNSTCHGDSGGPLICRSANGRWKLVGVTSTGLSCGEQGTPSVFTRVSRYIDFIRYTIASDGRPTHSIHLSANESAIITSPSYPESYPVRLDVTWVITTETNQALQINTSSFDSDPGGDIVSIGEGVDFTRERLFAWSGVNLPPIVHSIGNEVWISFTSDNFVSTPRSGFAVTVSSIVGGSTCTSDEFYCRHFFCIDLTSKCDYRQDCPDGSDEAQCEDTRLHFISPNETLSVVSPLYPDNYPTNIELVWIIQTEMNWTILISFSSFSTEGGYDYFRAGNGADFKENMFFEWSGNILPNDQLSTGNILWLRFTSDSIVTERGFSLTATSVPLTETTEPATTTPTFTP